MVQGSWIMAAGGRPGPGGSKSKVLLNRLLMVHGTWLMAQSSWLMATGGRPGHGGRDARRERFTNIVDHRRNQGIISLPLNGFLMAIRLQFNGQGFIKTAKKSIPKFINNDFHQKSIFAILSMPKSRLGSPGHRNFQSKIDKTSPRPSK